MDKIEYTPDERSGFEAINEAADRFEEKQKKYNIFSKNLAYIIGRNLTLFLCALVPMLLVASIWTDFGEIVISTKMISDGVLTVSMFVTGELLTISLGSGGGKLDSDFLAAKGRYGDVLDRVNNVGTIMIGLFCEWQIDLELEQAIQNRLRILRMTRKEWESVKHLSKEELTKRYGKIKAGKICEINSLMPIELNEAILLYGNENAKRGGIPISGDSYIRSKWHVAETVAACLFTGLLTVSIVLTFTSDVTVARVVYTAFKLILLLFRMCRGYERGARAYNTIEVRSLNAKTSYLEKYLKFVEDEIYLTLDEKYDANVSGVNIKNKGDVLCEKGV